MTHKNWLVTEDSLLLRYRRPREYGQGHEPIIISPVTKQNGIISVSTHRSALIAFAYCLCKQD